MFLQCGAVISTIARLMAEEAFQPPDDAKGPRKGGSQA